MPWAADNLAYCWGSNGSGQLGDGTRGAERLTPTPVSGGVRFRQVATGFLHTCGVTTANLIFCWGEDDNGQIGDGPTEERRLVPTPIASGRQFRQVDLGFNHSCAVTTDNRGFCWGDNSFGEIGDGARLDRFEPRAVRGGLQIERVNSGNLHNCAEVVGNQVHCWGSNRFGQFGNGTTQDLNVRPVLAAGGRRFVQVTGGGSHTCGVNANAAAFCWGLNSEGQLGIGSSGGNRTTPVRVVSP